MSVPDPFLDGLEDEAPFDLPVPRDLLLELDLDEIERAVGQLEADPSGLGGRRRRLAGLASRLRALADRA